MPVFNSFLIDNFLWSFERKLSYHSFLSFSIIIFLCVIFSFLFVSLPEVPLITYCFDIFEAPTTRNSNTHDSVTGVAGFISRASVYKRLSRANPSQNEAHIIVRRLSLSGNLPALDSLSIDDRFSAGVQDGPGSSPAGCEEFPNIHRRLGRTTLCYPRDG